MVNQSAEHFDVIIIGAGLSGIGAARHLQLHCPSKRFVLLEARSTIGGTWDLFRYPGIRSDSDMHTLGYNFKPWKAAKAIADGPAILNYIQETATENDIQRHIRLEHKVVKAAWSSSDARWTVTVQCGSDHQLRTYTTSFLLGCSGYYSYRSGYVPALPGIEQFQGPVVQPQQWPEGLDYTDQRVVVIGSGATAMTLVPSMASKARHVTMLQRSPTYVIAMPDRDLINNGLRRVLPEKWAYAVTRWKNVFLQQVIYNWSRRSPDKARKLLLKRVRKELGADYDVEKHFSPRYNPWDERLCLVPNGDLFQAIRSGKVSVVTDQIESITPTGVALRSGQHLDADILILATGLNLVVAGEAEVEVDGRRVNFPDTWSYKGMMYTGLPNLATVFGYVNASWTLRADLIAEFVCRLINHMDQTGTQIVEPCLRPEDADMQPRPWIEGFTPGYIQRAVHLLPKQGDREPWINPQNYRKDKKMFHSGSLEDGVLQFRNPSGQNGSRQ
ncbi:MAG: NAD(P)/FAD-dependent oxidoreductase [Pirellulaceae bacterium]|nr:NAD(P)/FAD-dependent oxidoreductase [Pirellulaceae bacterium]